MYTIKKRKYFDIERKKIEKYNIVSLEIPMILEIIPTPSVISEYITFRDLKKHLWKKRFANVAA